MKARKRTIARREFVGGIAGAAASVGLGLKGGAKTPPAEQNLNLQSGIVTLDAKPEQIDIDIAETVVIVVDMQNDFGSKGGMFERAGIDISMIQRAVAPTAKVLASARKAGIKVVYLKMAFRPDLSDAGSPDSRNRRDHLRVGVGTAVRAPNGAESRILVRGYVEHRYCERAEATGCRYAGLQASL
jgi:hypothetical protein